MNRLVDTALVAVLVLALAPRAPAEVVVSPAIVLGDSVVDPVRNRVYTLTDAGLLITDGDTGGPISLSLFLLSLENSDLALDIVRHRAWVVSQQFDQLLRVDGATLAESAVAVPNGAGDLTLDPDLDRVFVVIESGNSVTVVDGTTLTSQSVPVAPLPRVIAVDPVTHDVYVGHDSQPALTVIDGQTLATSTIPLGATPSIVDLAVNPVTRHVYAYDATTQLVFDVDAAALTATTFPGAGEKLAVNPFTDTMWTERGTVFDLATNTPMGGGLGFLGQIALEPGVDRGYVAEPTSFTLATIDAFGVQDPLPTSFAERRVAVDPIRRRVFTNTASGGRIIARALEPEPEVVVADVIPASSLDAIVIDAAARRVYVSRFLASDVLVFDADSLALLNTISVPTEPTWAVVDTRNHEVWVECADELAIVDEAGLVTTLPLDTSLELQFDAARNRMVSALGVEYDVVDRARRSVASPLFAVTDVATHPETGVSYVTESFGSLVEIDYALFDVVGGTTPGTSATEVGLDPLRGEVYVVDDVGGTVFVVDEDTLAAQPVAVGNFPTGLAVDVARERVYVTSTTGIERIDGTTATTIVSGTGTGRLTLDEARARVAFAGPSSVLLQDVTLDCPLVSTSTSATTKTAIDPFTGALWVHDRFCGELRVSRAPASQSPLDVAITPLPLDKSKIRSPTFTLTATSAPGSAPVRQVWVQVDTITGEWAPATKVGDDWTFTPAPLTLGPHVVYAFATDAQDPGVTHAVASRAPIVGDFAAYAFTVTGPWQSLGASLAGDGEPPRLIGEGTLEPASDVTITMSRLLPGSASLIVGISVLAAPFKGGTFVPDTDLILILPIGASGVLQLNATWPAGFPTDFDVNMQVWQADPAGPKGFTASNAIRGTTP